MENFDIDAILSNLDNALFDAHLKNTRYGHITVLDIDHIAEPLFELKNAPLDYGVTLQCFSEKDEKRAIHHVANQLFFKCVRGNDYDILIDAMQDIISDSDFELIEH